MVRQPDRFEARQVGRLLRQASADARRIASEAMPWSNPLAQLIQAAIATIHNDGQGALRLLAAAEAGFTSADMLLYQQLARRRRGQLIGGEPGAALVVEADGWIAEREVRKPERVAQLLAPGKW
jgi:hypothetical protein